MKTTENPHLLIGEFSLWPETNPKRAILPCRLPGQSNIKLMLFDKFGITCQKKEFQVEEGNNELELNCDNLSGGDYSAWIELEGKTYLRGFYVKKEEKKKSFFEKLVHFVQARRASPLYY